MIQPLDLLDIAVGAFLAIVCLVAGIKKIAYWWQHRAEDFSFSWKRVLKLWAGYSPRESLLEGIVGILMSGCVALWLISVIMNVVKSQQ